MHGRLIARVAAVVATLAALLASAAFTTSAHAAGPGLNGRIAFGWSDSRIATIEADGTRGRTAFDRQGGPWETLKIVDPAYSPDGRKLAFTGVFGCDGCGLETSRIGVIDADGHVGQPLNLVNATSDLIGLANPTWTADGIFVAFEAYSRGGLGYGIYSVRATGGEPPIRLGIPAAYKDPQDPAFSPDHRLLAFTAEDEDGDRRVYVMNLDTDAVTQVTTEGANQQYPAFSPDSRSIAYVNVPFAPGGGFGYPELVTRPLAGGAPEVLWSNQSEYGRWATNRPSYSPDGKHIVFSATRAGDPQCPSGDLMVVNTTGAANPRSIACGGQSLLGNVSWGARAPQGRSQLASAVPGSAREGGDGDSDPARVTADGRHAVFVSKASNLDGYDAGGFSDVFLRDLATNDIEMLSVDDDQDPANGDSDMPIVTPDGEWVAFRSKGAVLAGFEGGDTAVWLRQVRTGTTILVSRNWRRARVGASGDNRPLAISDDGRYVLFSSTARDLDADHGEAWEDHDVDLFRWDRVTNTTAIVTAKAGDPAKVGNDEATGVAYMSADGNTVVFESEATDLVDGFVDRNGADQANVFVRDIDANTTTLVDGRRSSTTEGVSAGTQLQGLSADGRVVLFQTTADDAVTDFVDGNGVYPDLYTRHLPTRRAFLITGAGGGYERGANGQGGLVNRDAVLSADGRHVLFNSDATNLNTQFTVTSDAWQVWTRALNEHGDPEPYAQLVTRGADRTRGADGGGAVVDTTPDGRYVLVLSNATDLSVPLTRHDWPTLYRVDTQTFEAEPISVNGDDANNAQPYVRRGGIAADGRTIVYPTRATNLIDGFIDGNTEAYSDVFAWRDNALAEQDVIAPTVTITTPEDDAIYRQGAQVIADYACADEGPSGLKRCVGPVPSGQPIDTSSTGEFEFAVTATDEAGNVGTASVRYRVAAANKKLKLVSGSGAASADGDSSAPELSADGRFLAFTSRATDLVEHGKPGVYRRDLTTGATELVAASEDPGAPAISPDGRRVVWADADGAHLRDMAGATRTIAAHGDGFAFSADGSAIVFTTHLPLVAIDDNGASDVYVYDVAKDTLTLVSVDATGKRAADGGSLFPVISADGTRVAWTAFAQDIVSPPVDGYWAHTYWRDLTTGVTKVVDRRYDKDVPSSRPVNNVTGPQISADGRTVLFGSDGEDLGEGYSIDPSTTDIDQVYVRDMTADAPTRLITSAHDNPRRGTGGNLEDAVLSADGTLVVWSSTAPDVIPDFVDHNDGQGWSAETELYVRRAGGPAALAAHGPDGPNHGLTYEAFAEQISTDNRFVVTRVPTRACDCERYADDLQRLDLGRKRFTNVAAAANRSILSVTASADTKRIAFASEADNLVDGFQDNNGYNAGDVFAWYDAPPVAAVTPSVTGSLKLRFDATGSSDSDGTVDHFTWAFGDGETAEGEIVEHTFREEDTYEVTLTIEDDGGNRVVHTFEAVAIKGVLTTGGQPIDFIGIDSRLRCSVVRGGPVLAGGGGACGTFVALDGKTYGPPELIDGTTDYTAVSQERTETGDTAKLVTVVALGDTGAQLRQTDTYTAGKAWYRTDVELTGASGATVYRAARCAIGADASRRSLHDQGTSTAGCDGIVGGDRTLAAWLPLTAGAKRDAGPATAVFGRIAAGAPLADTCACGAQADPGAAIAWTGVSKVSSVAAFGPDGVIPMTLDVAADKAEVQPLDENAFTVTLRNPNAGERAVETLAIDHANAWDHRAGSTTGLSTADPTVEGIWATWDDLKVAGHGAGTLRFGVQHRSGERTATTTAAASGEVLALGAGATVVARSVAGAKPNTAITSGPTGLTTDRDPAFALEASKAGVSYECRFGDAAWAPCEGNPHRPGPLADGEYVLEARAVDAVGADETPARRTFVVDTAAPNTSITGGPKAFGADNRPVFSYSSTEAGTRFQCNLGRGWFACAAPAYRAPALADGTYTFAVKAVDAAGNEDATPATLAFTIDTTPPVTVIDGVTAKVVVTRAATGATTSAGPGASVVLGTDGSAGMDVACPADGPPCNGAVGLATQPAGAAQARPSVPAGAITLARAEFSARPGQTVAVKLPLSQTVVNTVERVRRMAVFTTIDTGDGRPVRGSDVVLTPDPRTARLLDAGRVLTVKGGKVKLRLACAKKTCSGTIKFAGRTTKFKGRGTVVVPVKKSTKRGKELAAALKTRLAPAKRLTLTLRAQEARR